LKYQTFTYPVLSEIVNQTLQQKTDSPVKYCTPGNPNKAAAVAAAFSFLMLC